MTDEGSGPRPSPSEKKQRGRKSQYTKKKRSRKKHPAAHGDSLKPQWLVDRLESLGHANPSSVVNCLVVNNSDSDGQLTSLAVWLEDRVIRQWEETRRGKLRTDFWGCCNRYLSDLDCPPCYHSNKSVAANSVPWRHDPSKRVKVVHWLVNSAVSEAFGDARDKREGKKDILSAGSVMSKKSDAAQTFSLAPGAFPLGFTTNDEDVDQIATVMRMRYVLSQRSKQDNVNQCVSDMQRVTVKPMGG